jgi:hypothetical protein
MCCSLESGVAVMRIHRVQLAVQWSCRRDNSKVPCQRGGGGAFVLPFETRLLSRREMVRWMGRWWMSRPKQNGGFFLVFS